MHPSLQTMSVLPPQPGRSIWLIFPTGYWSHLLLFVVGGDGVTVVVGDGVSVVVVLLSHFGLFDLVLSVPPPSQE